MIIEVHRKVNNNVGDLYCNPSRYFDLGEVSSEELLYNNSDIKNNTLVIGGGGLIHKKFSNHIKNLLDKNPKNSVLWGIGHNFGPKFESKSLTDPYYPNWTKSCTLVGIRDYIIGHYDTYLPCVSCMHPAFNKKYTEEHEVVYFTHAFKSKYAGSNFPHMKNNEMNFDKVISFLASGRTVVTDSYHGAYWAQLLGKNVHTVSWSVKFNYMKHRPNFLTNINDTNLPKISNSIDGFLDECKSLNQKFYRKYQSLK